MNQCTLASRLIHREEKQALSMSYSTSVLRVTTTEGASKMSVTDQDHCRWCGAAISRPKRGQKFCSSNHRYLWHKNQLISPAQLERKISEIVRKEVKNVLDERLAERLGKRLGTNPEEVNAMAGGDNKTANEATREVHPDSVC